MIEQNLVEITTCDLISVIGLRAIAVLKVKLRSTVGTRAHDPPAVLFQDPGIHKFLVQPEPGKRFHAERQKRFADVKAREFFTLEKNDAAPGTGEQRRCRDTRGDTHR